MSIKINAEQLTRLIQLDFLDARTKLAKVEGLTETQWVEIVNLFGDAEQYAYRLIKASNASGELGD